MAKKKETPWRIINPLGLTWSAKFTTEKRAWSRVLSANSIKEDTRAARLALAASGWRVVEKSEAARGFSL